MKLNLQTTFQQTSIRNILLSQSALEVDLNKTYELKDLGIYLVPLIKGHLLYIDTLDWKRRF